ncbi:hypothetical protein LQE92_08905 [Lacrimispora sp. NSJ-141]|uniref:Uncharacterized protein n=1 Tax=Lientehia hominis TaxID=2897778 RepID=A0AAP2W912_9FIRM|nr:hypothetical protein [Lientehia hominis]MCD2492746.1 hypothetical protein [Lientehia hominis]
MTNGTRIRYRDNEHLADIIKCPYPVEDRPCDRLAEERNCKRCKMEWLEREEEKRHMKPYKEIRATGKADIEDVTTQRMIGYLVRAGAKVAQEETAHE